MLLVFTRGCPLGVGMATVEITGGVFVLIGGLIRVTFGTPGVRCFEMILDNAFQGIEGYNMFKKWFQFFNILTIVNLLGNVFEKVLSFHYFQTRC